MSAVRAAGSLDDASLRHLTSRLTLLEERVRALVTARRSADPEPDDRFRGLYVSDRQADALLSRPAAPALAAPGSDAATPSPLEAAEAEANELEAAGRRTRLRALCRAFDLGALDQEILLVALAPDVDPRLEGLYGYLNDDVSRRRASIGLTLALCGLGSVSAGGRARFGAHGALVEHHLLTVEDPERPFLTRALRVPDRVVGFLIGDDSPDPRLVPVLAPTVAAPQAASGDGSGAPPAAGADAEIVLSRALRAGADLAYLRERVGSDGRQIATAALARLGVRAIALDLEALPPEPDAGLAIAACLEARLYGSALVAGPIEALDERSRFVRQLADLPCAVVLHGSRDWNPTWSRKTPLLLDAPSATAAEQARAWRAGLAGLAEAEAVANEVAAYPFRVTAAAIRRAAAIARIGAASAGRAVGAADLSAGVRAQNATGLQKLARRIEPRAGWPDLVLPADTLEQLGELANRARFRDRVLDEWGLGDPNRGRGLTALFTGDSGTGKTVSAEVLAGELGLDLYVIDLSSIVDKYIGETEKNLDRVFSQADGVNGVLLFDEADAIFGKRSEVRDARDRYANVEIAYLLQRMERFDGLAILTTNLRANLDEAFLRRLDVLVDFPMPEEPLRRRLWQRHLRPSVPVADDLDLDFLARNFRISGGSIRNIVATAAYNAAADGRPVAMADLIKGTEREYRKLGNLSTEAEFGPYFQSRGTVTEATR